MGPTRRQFDIYLPATVPDHHIGQEFTQKAPVLGRMGVAAHHKLVAELLGRFELARY